MEKKSRQEMLEVLFQIPTQMRKLDTQTMLKFLMQKIVEVLKVERVSIYEVFDEFEEFRLILGEPEGKHGIGQILLFREFPYHAEAVKTKIYLQKKEPGLDPSIKQTKELIYVEGITAWLMLPLLIENEVEWLVVVDAKWPRMEFFDDEISFCISLGNQAELLLERDKIQKVKDGKETMAEIGEVAEEAVHRLRNPIHYIHGYAARLLKLAEDWPFIPWTVKDYAERIYAGVVDLERTANSLLSFSRPKRVDVEMVNVNEIIMKIYRSLYGLTEKKNIKFAFGLDQQLPFLTADPQDIEEVVSPILRNAVEAIKKDGEIRIKTKCENGCLLRISISNNGGCVAEEILKEIFNPFFTTKPDGLGLGLAIANSTVSSYGGDIRAENNEPLGVTTFTVRFPLDVQQERR